MPTHGATHNLVQCIVPDSLARESVGPSGHGLEVEDGNDSVGRILPCSTGGERAPATITIYHRNLAHDGHLCLQCRSIAQELQSQCRLLRFLNITVSVFKFFLGVHQLTPESPSRRWRCGARCVCVTCHALLCVVGRTPSEEEFTSI